MPKQSKLQKLREYARGGGQKAVERAQAQIQKEKERARQRLKETNRKDVRKAVRKAGMTIDVSESPGRRPRAPEKRPSERAGDAATMAPPTPARFNPTSNPEKLHMLAGGGGIGQPLRLDDDPDRRDGDPAGSPLGTGRDRGAGMEELVTGSDRDRGDRRRDDDPDPLAVDEDLLRMGGDR